MARVIEIDDDTLIGYDFENTLYFITNKNTTTTRVTKEEAKQVLDIVAPSNEVTLEQLQNLHDTYEALQDLYYTYEDTGKYIKTIQLNSYDTHPLTLDLSAKKLYVMNTDLIFDLTLFLRTRMKPITVKNGATYSGIRPALRKVSGAA